uniref:ATP synthase subunit a n=1 Tax=Ceraphronidae sp. ZJUH_2016007 TaxID=2491153 RepID=A0A3S8V0G2_9HYME|nr:ATP synthase F0 subunit 6 [Ceraphronidae sp. ZJUH_2016007]
MMTNLFSIFDPTNSNWSSMNWMTPLMCLMIMPYMLWIIPSNNNIMWMKILNNLSNEIKTILKNSKKKNMFVMISIIFMIMMINFFSLTPYIFTNSAHLTFSLSLSLPLWISFMMFGWSQNTMKMFVHLVPQGTPPPLMPFMVLIESISNIIRPLTLAVRLSANMIAGHLLLTLLSSTGNFLNIFLLSIMLLTQYLLLTLEMSVALIQAYVFSILSTLYCSESTYEN